MSKGSFFSNDHKKDYKKEGILAGEFILYGITYSAAYGISGSPTTAAWMGAITWAALNFLFLVGYALTSCHESDSYEHQN